MKKFLKKLNIHDFLILLLGLVIILPYKAYPFLIGHIYIHEIIIFIYFFINLIVIYEKKDFKEIVTFNDIQKVFLVFVFFVLINYIFSFYLFREFPKDLVNTGIKVHINVLRGYIEFLIILLFFLYNIKKSNIRINGFLYYIAALSVVDMLVPVVKLILVVDIKKLIADPKLFMQFRAGIGRPANLGLPDGASAIIFLGIANYLFSVLRNRYFKIFIVIFSFLSLIVVFVTYARIYTLGLVGIILFGTIFIYKKNIKIVIIGASVLFLLLGGFRAIKGRFLDTNLGENTIGSGRFLLIASVNDLFAADIYNLVYGAGAGNYFYYNIKLVKNKIFNVGFSGPHNQLFTVLVDFGILGYLLFIFSVLFLFYKNYFFITHSKLLYKKLVRKNLLGIVFSFLLMGIAGDMFISYHPPMTHYLMFLWMFISLLSMDNEELPIGGV